MNSYPCAVESPSLVCSIVSENPESAAAELSQLVRTIADFSSWQDYLVSRRAYIPDLPSQRNSGRDYEAVIHKFLARGTQRTSSKVGAEKDSDGISLLFSQSQPSSLKAQLNFVRVLSELRLVFAHRNDGQIILRRAPEGYNYDELAAKLIGDSLPTAVLNTDAAKPPTPGSPRCKTV